MPEENKLKIAMLHVGQPRTYKRCLNNWIKATSAYDVDFFIGAYDEHGHRLDPIRDNARQWSTHKVHNPDSKQPIIDRRKIDVDEFVSDVSVLSPKDVFILSWEEADVHIRKDMEACGFLPDPVRSGGWLDLPTSLWHQYYILKKTFERIDDPDSYDLIVRARLDAAWVGYPIFRKIDYVEYPFYHDKFPHDYLAVGPPDLMRKVCNIYDEFPRFFRDRGKYKSVDLGRVGRVDWSEAAYNAHCAFGILYTEIPSKPSDMTDTSNAMSLIRKGLYPDSRTYDVSFLLEPEHSSRWRSATVNQRNNYVPVIEKPV